MVGRLSGSGQPSGGEYFGGPVPNAIQEALRRLSAWRALQCEGGVRNLSAPVLTMSIDVLPSGNTAPTIRRSVVTGLNSSPATLCKTPTAGILKCERGSNAPAP